EYTPEGRQIIQHWESKAAPPLIENAPHGHLPGSEKAKQANDTLAAVEEADRKLVEERKKAPPPEKPKYSVEIDLSNPDDPIVRGEAGDVLPLLQKFIQATWRDDWWHIRPADVATIHAASQQLGFGVTEFPSQGKKGTAVQSKAGAGPAQATAAA